MYLKTSSSDYDKNYPKIILIVVDNQNDNFDLSGMDVLKLKIFNRYGREVFEQDNYESNATGKVSTANCSQPQLIITSDSKILKPVRVGHTSTDQTNIHITVNESTSGFL